MFPIRYKPEHSYDHASLVTTIPNALPEEHIERIKTWALTVDSGLHRRGSKNIKVNASFYTTQINNLSDPIYEILSPLWEQHLQSVNSTVSFIEPYEIKSYIEGDEFENHYDIYINLTEKLDRKINLIVQLTDSNDYEGGDLYVGDYLCPREKGSAIFFPASVIHKVTKITKGNRFSLIGHGWGPYLI